MTGSGSPPGCVFASLGLRVKFGERQIQRKDAKTQRRKEFLRPGICSRLATDPRLGQGEPGPEEPRLGLIFMPLLTELESREVGIGYKHVAPNGAVPAATRRVARR